MSDDLSIPACLNLRDPEVAAKRELQRKVPVTAMPAFVEHKRNLDEESRKFWEAEQERERIEKENGLAAFNEKKVIKKVTILGGRYDSRTNRWVTPEEDFAEMAHKARRQDGSTVTVDELRAVFEEVAKLPDLPLATYQHNRSGQIVTVDPNQDCCRAFARRILATIDSGRLALEAEKSLERQRRRIRRKADKATLATINRAAANAAKTDLSMTPRQRAWIERRAKKAAGR